MRAVSYFVLVAAAFGASPVWASEPPAAVSTGAASGATAVPKADPVVCQSVQQIGSLLRSKKVCMRKSEWAEQRRGDRANIDRSQVQVGTATQN